MHYWNKHSRNLNLSVWLYSDGLYVGCLGHSVAASTAHTHTDRAPSNVKWPEGLKFCTDRPTTFSTRRQSNFSLISVRQIAAESDDYTAPAVHPTKALVVTKGNTGCWPGHQISTGTGLGASLVCAEKHHISKAENNGDFHFDAQSCSNKPFSLKCSAMAAAIAAKTQNSAWQTKYSCSAPQNH